MKIQELIERLTEIADVYPDAEVLLATQPNWPITETLRGVADPDAVLGDDDRNGADLGSLEPVVWLVSGGQPTSNEVSPYAPRWVFEAAS